MDAMQEAELAFLVEARELLAEMEESLLGLEELADEAQIAALFRSAHTIKGSSGLFGFDAVVAFTHVVESVLDRLRDGEISVSSELIALLLPCKDHISSLLDICANHAEPDADLQAQGDGLIRRLSVFLGKSELPAHHEQSLERIENAVGTEASWHLSLRFGVDCFRNGMDPLSFIRFLSTLGEITRLVTLNDALPEAASMDAESCYLGFEIDLQSTADKAAIENVFEFVREDSVIRILPAHAKATEFITLIQSLPEDDSRLGEILVKSGVLTRNELELGLSTQEQPSGTEQRQPLGRILVAQGGLPSVVMEAAVSKQKQARDGKAKEAKSIRVDADRLDELIDLVGELIIAGAGALVRAEQSKQSPLIESVHQVISYIEVLRDSALRLRMVPIGATFARFQRVVRDVATDLGKQIRLDVAGADTEVDKTVAELIADPLMHLVRNSLDHGLEKPDVRLAANKAAEGVLSLAARHESGNIVIEVSDDGAGLNRERILSKAIERGLVKAEAELSDQEVWSLIFEPGFSTADAVSNLSGRGVGMDVVKRNITQLRGSIEIESVAGRGAVFTLRLPLTLAIIDGFRVEVGTSHYVVPLKSILECVDLPMTDQARDYMELRGEVLPLIRLREFYGCSGAASPRPCVVVVATGSLKVGLVVDRLVGEFQTVIKPLGKLFENVSGLGGFTMLGTGDIALILDVGALTKAVSDKQIHANKRIPSLN